MTAEGVTRAYARLSAEYAALFGDVASIDRADSDAILSWATAQSGMVVDVGCGPGQWTRLLSSHGVLIRGIDPTVPFIVEARRRYPRDNFEVGRAECLAVADGQLGGVLAWFSLIHLPPDAIGPALNEFARALRVDGGLALGFFEGPRVEPFDHAVTTAYRWPLDVLAGRIEAAGFTVTRASVRTPPGRRRQGLILATRSPLVAKAMQPGSCASNRTKPRRGEQGIPVPHEHTGLARELT